MNRVLVPVRLLIAFLLVILNVWAVTPQAVAPRVASKSTPVVKRTPVVAKKRPVVTTVRRSSVPVRRTAVRPVARRSPVRRAAPVPARPADLQPRLEDLPPLAFPLDNLTQAELADSFFHRRGRGLHYAIDIMRPIGDPLYAVADGVVQQMAWSARGGRSVYLLDREGQYRFFYCHLSRYAPGLVNGAAVRRGDLIGYVGNTGNARYTAPHLHFEIVRLVTSAASTVSRVLNPYPLLRQLLEQPPLPPPPPLPVLANELVVPSYDQQ